MYLLTVDVLKNLHFNLTTSSPHFPQSNGLAECNVKNLFKKAKESGHDPEMALLEFRNTPVTGLNTSPAQLLGYDQAFL